MKKVIIILLFAFYINEANTQTPSILKDIYNYQTNGSINSGSANYTKVGTTVFFRASQNATGIELYKTDGTAGGTVLVKDIYPGIGGSTPSHLTNVNGVLFFIDDENKLWKSDGTEAGTILVKDIYHGNTNLAPNNLTNVNGVLFFNAYTSETGRELWKSDGTDAGTVLVKDIYPGSDFSNPQYLTNVNGTLYFSADGSGTDDDPNEELWKSDGTEAGTVLVKDIYPGIEGSAPSSLTNVNGILFFSAYGVSNGRELWKSDGTEGGTILVKNINPINPFVIGSTLYFIGNNGINGNELWKSNGTDAGTMMVKDINAGLGEGVTSSYPFANVDGTLYFSAYTSSSGYELWKSNGTEEGTLLVKDMISGSVGSTPMGLTTVNGTLFFYTLNSNKKSLWKSNGTEAGTVELNEAAIGGGTITDMYAGPNQLYFTYEGYKEGFPSTATGAEPWTSNGTDAGTDLLKDINIATGGSSPSELCKVGNNVFFAANDGLHGDELWKTDGTVAGTVLVKDIVPGQGNASLNYLTAVNNTLFFKASTSGEGAELWKSDGTLAGTVMVKDIYSGAGSSFPLNLKEVNGSLYFSAMTAGNGREIWKSDGTEAGTIMIKDIMPGPTHSNPNKFVYVNGIVFFTAQNGNSGGSNDEELWKTDGTDAGTILVKDIYPGTSSSSPSSLVNFKSKLYFAASDGVKGSELWTSDGTSAGTNIFKDIYAGSASSTPSVMTVLDNTMYFYAKDIYTGNEIWKSDGTPEGTTIVKDFTPGSGGDIAFTPFENVAGTLYLTVYSSPLNGWQLWKTDGTEAGTKFVNGIYTYSSSSPSELTNLNGKLYFSASDLDYGNELWKSDGTKEGTIVFDLMTGTEDSKPTGLIVINNKLLFAAGDLEKGRELWVTEVGAMPLNLLDFSAQKNDKTVVLKWETTNEVNTGSFEIERAANSNFVKIGEVAALNRSGQHNYKMVDEQPLNDANYYRLKMIDIDGSFTYSSIKKVDFNKVEQVSIFPNPASNELKISNVSGYDFVQVMDASGRVVHQQKISGGQAEVNIQKLLPGNYVLRLTGNSIQKFLQFVKQ